MTIEHTPTPWILGKIGDPGYSKTVAPCHIWTAKGPGNGLVATTAPDCEPYEQQRVDAAYIVKAANAYPQHLELIAKLVEALKRADAALWFTGRSDAVSAMSAVRAALAAARALASEPQP